MSFNPRRILTPGAAVTTSHDSFVKPPRVDDVPSAHPAQAKGKKSTDDSPPIDNQLLAGYLAHEFLTRGTILGQREAAAVAGEPRRKLGLVEPSQRKGKLKEIEEDQRRRKQEDDLIYADVAGMLRTDGVHIPGVVNPSQLVTWLRQ